MGSAAHLLVRKEGGEDHEGDLASVLVVQVGDVMRPAHALVRLRARLGFDDEGVVAGLGEQGGVAAALQRFLFGEVAVQVDDGVGLGQVDVQDTAQRA